MSKKPEQRPELKKVASSRMADGTKWWELDVRKPKR